MRKTLILAIALFAASAALAQAPTPVVVTDKNGNTLTITGATSGSQTGSPTPVVLTDKNGNALVLGAGSSGVPAGVIDASSSTYGAKWDAQQISTASITSGSAVVTSSQSIFKASDVGKVGYGFQTCATDLPVAGAQTAILARTTIIAFTSATSITVNTTASATKASTACFIWGTPDDAAFTLIDAAAAASTVCPTIVFPAKSTILEQGHLNNAAPVACANSSAGLGGTVGGYGEVIQGQGKGASVLFLAPTLATVNSATCNGGSGLNDCFGGQMGQVFRDFRMDGGGNNASAFPVAKNLMELASYSSAVRFAFFNFGAADANLTFLLTAIGTVQLSYSELDGTPPVTTGTAGFYFIDHSDIQDICSTSQFIIQNGATVISHGSLFAPGNCTTTANSLGVNNNGVWTSHGDLVYNDAGGTVRYILVSTGATGKSYLYGTTVSAVNVGSTTTGVPISAGASGAYIQLNGVITRGVSADPAWSVAAGATIYDNGGNTIIGGTGIGIGGVLLGTGSVVSRQTNTSVASRNTTLGATTLVAANAAWAGTPQQVVVKLNAYDSAAGTSCAGNTTVLWTINYTDATGTAQTQTATETITTNGGATGGDKLATQFALNVNSGTAITYQTTYTIGGSCSPGPSYAAQINLQ